MSYIPLTQLENGDMVEACPIDGTPLEERTSNVGFDEHPVIELEALVCPECGFVEKV